MLFVYTASPAASDLMLFCFLIVFSCDEYSPGGLGLNQVANGPLFGNLVSFGMFDVKNLGSPPYKL